MRNSGFRGNIRINKIEIKMSRSIDVIKLLIRATKEIFFGFVLLIC